MWAMVVLFFSYLDDSEIPMKVMEVPATVIFETKEECHQSLYNIINEPQSRFSLRKHPSGNLEAVADDYSSKYVCVKTTKAKAR
jgi:hypothetical protein